MSENKKESALGRVRTDLNKFFSFWLFDHYSKDLSALKKTAYFVFNIAIILCALISLNTCSLYLAFGDGYPIGVFFGYYKNIYILVLNFLPLALLFVLLYGIFGRGWLAYLIDSIVVMGFNTANFFMLKFRDDPLMFSDLLHVREAAMISEEGYSYYIDEKMTVCYLTCIMFTLLLYLFQGFKPKLVNRICCLLIPLLLIVPLKSAYFSKTLYNKYTGNFGSLNKWIPAQVFISKGFVYPFINSMQDFFGSVPKGYNARNAAEILEGFTDADIPEDKKVDVIGIMLEAYCDIENLGIHGIDESVYSLYDNLKKENYCGTLLTNIFAAGTIDSERAFLTGYSDIYNYRHNINSYVRYFKNQGYITEGSHPSNEWFYNRKYVNKYMGFDDYRFAENYFEKHYDEGMRSDSVVFEDFYDSYKRITEKSDKPYFGFHVTYQGHGPYGKEVMAWGTDEKPLYYNEDISEESNTIINNYLGSVKDTTWRLSMFVEKLKAQERPVILVVFGDHKPWFGDNNSVYKELGINLDVSTLEGYLNYYSTEYLIVANDAAKEVLGNDFKGRGKITSPCFLMNKVFELAGFDGPSYMQYTDTVMDKILTVNETGIIDSKADYYTTESIPEHLKKIYDEYKQVAYYTSSNFE